MEQYFMETLTANTAPTAEASSSSFNTKNTHRWKISNKLRFKKPNIEGNLPIKTKSWRTRFALQETSTVIDATNKYQAFHYCQITKSFQ